MPIRHFTVFTFALMLFSAPASAGVRSFFSPSVDGVPVAACLLGDEGCGKPAADAFCRHAGYDRSVLFERQTVPATRSLRGSACEGSECTAFRQIKCYSVKNDLAALGG